MTPKMLGLDRKKIKHEPISNTLSSLQSESVKTTIRQVSSLPKKMRLVLSDRGCRIRMKHEGQIIRMETIPNQTTI